MASIEGNYPNVFSRRARSIGRNAVRRIGTLQRLFDRLGLNGIAIAVCIVNGSAFGISRAVNNRKRIIPVREINLMFSTIVLQNIGY